MIYKERHSGLDDRTSAADQPPRTHNTPAEMDTKIFLSVVIIGCCCCMVANAQIPNCCLTVKNRPVDKIRVVDYYQQISGQGCFIDATVLVTRHGRKLCVPLNVSWVLPIKVNVVKLKKHCKEVNYQGIRCFGVKPE